MCYEAGFFFCLATFGLPLLELQYSVPLLTVFPFLAHMRLAFKYYEPEAAAAPAEVTDNGTATKIPAEEAAQEAEAPAAEAEEAPAAEKTAEASPEPAAAEEEKKDGEAAPATEIEAKPEAAAAEPSKPSLLRKAAERVAGIASAAKIAACDACAKVAALPWDSIVATITSLGTASAVAVAYWTLTEDLVVLLLPVIGQLLPVVSEKAASKNWLTPVGLQLVGEAGQLTVAVAQYYIFRSYISLPF
jgi:hypothetical protein